MVIELQKVPSGIKGLDEVSGGGLPKGRPILVCGSAGAGKTLLGTQFLVQGIQEYDEPGVFLSFEESTADLVVNVASLGYDLQDLIAEQKLAVDHVDLQRADMVESGDFSLEGLLVRLELAINRVQAKRVVIDTLEVLFGHFENSSIVRTELQRLFRWLKARELTTIITAERGPAGQMTRFGIEEYVSDCVISLDHRVTDELSTRRLRIVKYRGALHGTNEYPFLIMQDGISVQPVTSVTSGSIVSEERLSTGLPRLDELLGGGVFRGNSVLVRGGAGSGKSTLAAYCAAASCERGEPAVFVSYEESEEQLLRNLRSVGLDLRPHVDSGLLHFVCLRSTMFGLEEHLVRLMKEVQDREPALVVVDPITSLRSLAGPSDVTGMLLRWLEYLKSRGVTSLATELGSPSETHTQLVSSIMDTWLEARTVELNGETNRLLKIVKSRGSTHSRQLNEFEITSAGIVIRDPYIGAGKVLTGSARLAQEAADREAESERQTEAERQARRIQAREEVVRARVAALWAELENETAQAEALIRQSDERQQRQRDNADQMTRHRSNE